MQTISFQEYSSDQRERLIKYIDSNLKFNVDLDPLKVRQYKPDWAENQIAKIEKILSEKQGNVLFIKLDEQIVGFIYYYIEDEDKKVIHLSKLFIEEEYRDKGVGKQAIALFEDWIKAKGYKYATINVFVHNQRALGLYKKLGYADRFIDLIKPL